MLCNVWKGSLLDSFSLSKRCQNLSLTGFVSSPGVCFMWSCGRDGLSLVFVIRVLGFYRIKRSWFPCILGRALVMWNEYFNYRTTRVAVLMIWVNCRCKFCGEHLMETRLRLTTAVEGSLGGWCLIQGVKTNRIVDFLQPGRSAQIVNLCTGKVVQFPRCWEWVQEVISLICFPWKIVTVNASPSPSFVSTAN